MIMTKYILWTKETLELFIDKALLTEDEEAVLRTNAKGWSIPKQSMELGMSESKISKINAKLKIKYDLVQKNEPSLPPRNTEKR